MPIDKDSLSNMKPVTTDTLTYSYKTADTVVPHFYYSNNTLSTSTGGCTWVGGNNVYTTGGDSYSYSSVVSTDTYESRIVVLEEENNSLRQTVKDMESKITYLMSTVEALMEQMDKDAKIIKLSEDDEKFKGILGDLLEEEDDA